MHKSTIVFALLAALLTGPVAYTAYRLATEPRQVVLGSSSAHNIPLGVPKGRGETQQFAARSVLLYDTEEQQIKLEQNAFERRPIASLSKIMTAMVALDRGIDWDTPAGILPEEYGPGGNLNLAPGETVSVRDLFNASLLGSANNATRAYVRVLFGLDPKEFVEAMNRKAVELGLEQTHFEDVTGLDPHNVSTAYEVARLAAEAFNEYPEIAQATSQTEYAFVVGGSGREHKIKNTNKLVTDGGMQFSGTKTGYLDEAGWCLVVQGTGNLKRRIAVVLDSPSENDHFSTIKKLIELPVL